MIWISYMMLTSLSVERVSPSPWLKRFAIPVVVTSALVFGIFDFYYEENFYDLADPRLSAFAALYLTPLFLACQKTWGWAGLDAR